MIDLFGRKIDYARISVTDRCNLRCKYCMPSCGVEKKRHDDILTIEQLCTVADALYALGVIKMRITGGEPLIRGGVMHLMEHIGSNKDVELVVTTNGTNLDRAMAEQLKRVGVRRVNLSLDTLNPQTFRLLTGGDINQVLNAVQAIIDAGLSNTKLNAVLIRGVNDNQSVYEMAKFASSKDMQMRFIELMPFGLMQEYCREHFVSADEIVAKFGLKSVGNDNKTQEYVFPDGTKVGFITALSHKFCLECNRVRITADGKLLNCLHSSQEYDLKPYLNDVVALQQYIEECVKHKPKEHHLDEGVLQQRIMETIGG